MIRKAIVLMIGFACGTSAAQVPEFTQQYKQRLGGAIDELRRVVDDFDMDAIQSGLTRETALDQMSSSNDPFVAQRAKSMGLSIVRLTSMDKHQRRLSDSNAVTRFPIFLSGLDGSLSMRTWDDFRPAIPTSAEGAVYFIIGFIFGSRLSALILSLFRRRKNLTANPK